MDKKTIIGVSVFFAVVIAIMFALIPVELKNQKYEKLGKLQSEQTNYIKLKSCKKRSDMSGICDDS